MADVKVEIDPEDVGLSSVRLERLSEHLHGYVDDGRLAGTACLVARRGRVAYLDHYGMRDREAGLPIEVDTIYRFYSMTKPLTSIALMQLCERGLVRLRDPIERFIPAFGDMQVLTGGSTARPMLRPAARSITVHDLLTHTSGLTYAFNNSDTVDGIYRSNGIDGSIFRELPAAEAMDRLAAMPLLFDPGTRWNYSMSTDVVGHLVELISDQSLDDYFTDHLFEPLGMEDSGFSVKPADLGRFAACYTPGDGESDAVLLDPPVTSAYSKQPNFCSGGGGMVSTMSDYHRFCLALMNGGELDGRRIIGPRTLDYMRSNHLPPGEDLVSFGRATFSETPREGVGFGLGFSVQLDPTITQVISSPGEFAWGGMASTAFWCDPVEDLHVIFLTQLIPSSTYPLRPELKALTYQALID